MTATQKTKLNSRNKAGGISDRASDIILVTLSILILAVVAYPLYYILIASFSNPYDVYAGKTFLLPSQFSLEGYKAVFADDSILMGYWNSIKCSTAPLMSISPNRTTRGCGFLSPMTRQRPSMARAQVS